MINGLSTLPAPAKFGLKPIICNDFPNDPICGGYYDGGGGDGGDVYNGGGGVGSGGGTGGGGVNHIPVSWAIGTFYGNAHGWNIILTIQANGTVIANISGSNSYGYLDNTTLTMGNNQSTLTQIVNGIRTTDINGEVINYSRTSDGGGSGSGGGNGSGGGTGGGVSGDGDPVNPIENDPSISGSNYPANNNPISQIFQLPIISNISNLVTANPLLSAGIVVGGIFLLTRRN